MTISSITLFDEQGSFRMQDYAGYSVYAVFCKSFRGVTHFKVGMSEMVYERLISMITACPFEYARAMHFSVREKREAHAVEAAIHRRLKAFRTRGEWFYMEGEEPELSVEFQRAVDEAVRENMKASYRWKKIDLTDVARFASEKAKPARPKSIKPRDFTSSVKRGKFSSSW
ncbi:MAG: GIY-YIG nuclease family protein [Nevskiaceae bacterium]|nr:MAG: GIY-YIG nuclease family protein [Nevskiaceae bacterium]